MKQSKNPQKIGEQETEQKGKYHNEGTGCDNHIAVLQKVIQQRINDLSGQ